MRVAVLPVMTVLTVISGAVGLQIGESAIAQIDPLYFQGPAPVPIAFTQSASAPPPNSFAAASGFAEGYAARSADCPDCGTVTGATGTTARSYGWEVLPDVSPALAVPRREPAKARPAVEEAVYERSPEAERVRRYTDYPINEEQAQARATEGVKPASDAPERP